MSVTRLGLGLAAIGRPAYITAGRSADLGDPRTVEALRLLCLQLLDQAYAAGVRYFDVARSYGRAEEFLGEWLAHGPTDVVVGSKWGYRYVGEWRVDADVHEIKDHSLAAFTRQLAETRALLGDHLAVYHVHSATLDTGVLDDTALHAALAALRDSGVRVGVSTSGPEQEAAIRKAVGVTVGGAPLFTSIQATWNVLETSAGGALADAAAAGCSVIVKEAVANGRLTATEASDRVAAMAAGWGIGVDQLAIAAALAQPWAATVLSGAATPEQLASNLAAAAVRLPPGALDELAELAEHPPSTGRPVPDARGRERPGARVLRRRDARADRRVGHNADRGAARRAGRGAVAAGRAHRCGLRAAARRGPGRHEGAPTPGRPARAGGGGRGARLPARDRLPVPAPDRRAGPARRAGGDPPVVPRWGYAARRATAAGPAAVRGLAGRARRDPARSAARPRHPARTGACVDPLPRRS